MSGSAGKHRVAIAGCGGRMGRALIEATTAAPDCVLSGALARAGSALLGQDAGAALGLHTGVQVLADPRQGLSGSQCLIDFTRPQATLEHLEVCESLGLAMVIGTTGFDPAGLRRIDEAARRIPIVFSPNMSVGVNVVLKLLEQAGRALSTGFDIEIIEAHHRHKVDAPSGTALKMGEAVARAAGRDLARDAVWSRHGQTGEREDGSIGFSVVRGGDIVGDHTVLFAGTGERIEITHKSSSRATYAEGSLRAVRFLAERAPGLYDMHDVLGLKA